MLGNKGSKKHYRTGGTRGGQDQFKWDDVKVDKYRENYLGHSVSAPVGRWQKGKDLTWYAKGTQADETKRTELENERQRIQELDQQLIDEQLGVRPKKSRFVDGQLDAVDLKQAFARGTTERDVAVDVERVQGLGQAPAKHHEHIERVSNTEKEIQKLQRQLAAPADPLVSFIDNSGSIAIGSSSIKLIHPAEKSRTSSDGYGTLLNLQPTSSNDRSSSYDRPESPKREHKHKKEHKEKKDKKEKREKKSSHKHKHERT